MVLRGERLCLEIDPATLAATLRDERSGLAWSSPCLCRLTYGGHILLGNGHFGVDAEGGDGAIRLTLHNLRYWARWPEHPYARPERGPDVRVELSIALRGDSLLLAVEDVTGLDDEEWQVIFPAGLMRFDSRLPYTVIAPLGSGVMFQFPCHDRVSLGGAMVMPCVAAGTEAGGLAAIINTPFDCNLRLDLNQAKPGETTIEPAFAFEQGFAEGRREVELHLLETTSATALAKLYRRRVMEQGRFVSLAEKIESSPDVRKLVGAVVWKHNVYSSRRPEGVEPYYSLYNRSPRWAEYEGQPANWTARELFETAHARGFDRLAVFNTGWNMGGYDSHYPTRLPPHRDRGTIAEFSQAAELARSLGPDYCYSIHDNYYEIYRNSPEFDEALLKRTRDGGPIRGGIWRGGRAFSLCPTAAMAYAERDLPRIARMVGRGGIYLDCFGGGSITGCHAPAHPLTRQGEVEARKEIYRFARGLMGSVATEYTPTDCYADVVDLGAFFYCHLPVTMDRPPVPVPLFQLTYHDSVLNYNTEGAFGFHGSEYLLLVASYGLLPFSLEPISLRLSRELRQAYTAELVEHDFLVAPSVRRDEEGQAWTSGVARSRFGDGTEVLANFLDEPYPHDGELIAPREFVLRQTG